MKNVTIAIDDELHRCARIHAAERGTSLSALVKKYLESLANGNAQPIFPGVREMHAPYDAQLSPKTVGDAGPPWLVDGKWVYTRDGKPRQPGAMKGLPPLQEGWDEWPDGFIDAMLSNDTKASKTWWINANDPLSPPKGK